MPPKDDEIHPPLAGRGIFHTTRWSVVLQARNFSDAGTAKALESLCSTYWYPLYAFARRQGHTPEDSEDLTQAFFARFIQKDYLNGIDRSKGRFRSFLLASFRHFISNEWDKQTALKRGGGLRFIPLDCESAENRYRWEPAHELTPEKLYERSWINILLERVLQMLRREYQAAGKSALFDAIEVYLERDRQVPPYAEVGRKLGLRESALKMCILRLRRRYSELLRLEIAQTLSEPAEIEDEIRSLFAALG